MLALLLAAAPAPAATILFEDGFNRPQSDVVGNGWSEIEDGSKDVAIRHFSGIRSLRLRDGRGQEPIIDAAATHAVDATGYDDLFLQFTWRNFRGGTHESGDNFMVDYAVGGGAFQTIFLVSLVNVTQYTFETVDLPSAAADRSDLRIRFRTSVDRSKEGAEIDFVQVLGDEIQVVPEPAVGVLLAPGLAAPARPSSRAAR